ncbi:MAG: PrsW family intramembrane metalloprotease [Planctomycetes bacterium]|nr:PrsW family intramembrane metalloprotease [Planctomycetota bacterium]
MGPVLILLHGIYVADRYEKEPVRNMLRYVFFGGLFCIPAAIIELVILEGLGFGRLDNPGVSLISFVAAMFLGVALVEEFGKRAVLYFCAKRDGNVNEPFDWIVYSVSVALGFALVENLLYVYQGGAATGILRAFTAVPEHALCGTFMGDRLARAAYLENIDAPAGEVRYERRMSIIEPALWHGFYDSLALGAKNSASNGYETLGAVLAASLLVLIIIQWVLGFMRIRMQQRRALDGGRIPPILISRKFL